MGQSPSGSDHQGASPGMALSASLLPMPVVPAEEARPAWAGRGRLSSLGREEPSRTHVHVPNMWQCQGDSVVLSQRQTCLLWQ
jgi:hypothetical protein